MPPTLEDDFSDPEDMPLDALPPFPSSVKGKAPAADPPFPLPPPGPGEPAIPRAVRILPTGGLSKVTLEEFQGWDAIYPIYIDAKRPQQDGARRVGKQTALEWPLAEQMAKACRMLGFDTVYEPSKTHPKDWANPGRVRVQLKLDGRPIHAAFRTKRILLTRICDLLRPHQPRTASPSSGSNPRPLPPIERRLPPNSPAISLGTLEGAIKGGGPMGMLGSMFGAGGGGEDDQPDEEVKKKETGPKIIKPKKVHIKRKR
ncbi:hypothetical protein JCM21900_000019 [Sporobolomyces salmonicolor]